MGQKFNRQIIDNIVSRAHYLANQMIFTANNRTDKEKGDPKIGGHSSASASSIHILGVIHLMLRSGFDFIANKPHASPADHAYNYLLDLLLKEDNTRLSLAECNTAMRNLRAFAKGDEPVFQSYHSAYDPDRHNFLPTGTVGIPQVNAGYLALAYRYARKHGYQVPNAHFWCILGDSEFREGSLFEAVPDFAEREISNLTWIVDYNRQSLDGHRMSNPTALQGTDDKRIKETLAANGWGVLEARHGKKRLAYFERDGGKEFRNWFENELFDYELQALLNVKEPKQLIEFLHVHHGKQIKNFDRFFKNVSGEELMELLRDFGGHDVDVLYDVLSKAKQVEGRPCLVIAHTLKGWGLKMAAMSSNHSQLPEQAEMDALREAQDIPTHTLFERFPENTKEGHFLKERGRSLYEDIIAQHKLKTENESFFLKRAQEFGEIPNTLDINFKMANFPHTQWMLGQLTAKLTRIANTPLEGAADKKLKPLNAFEKSWKLASELIVSMAPDVGTSTNLNPSMDGKIFGTEGFDDLESELSVRDEASPDLVPGQQDNDRFIRFEIAEQNTMSCMGSIGKLREILGIPLLPLMTVYDFFIKRAHDQYFYNLYWKSGFILVGTPAGVTLSPEGAQHGWKSDYQIPNQITWEPFFVHELDWIFSDAVRRHMLGENVGRSGVLIRGVTRGTDQKEFLKNLRLQSRYQRDGEPMADEEILPQVQADVLAGGYYLVDHRNKQDYSPGDNVVHIFAMGSLGTEALKASEGLLAKGIYANVIMVTGPDLLLGNLAYENNYQHLRNGLEINDALYVRPSNSEPLAAGEIAAMSGQRIPIVSVHDGEPGLLDNIGSIVGVRHISLAVRKHSKCGRPNDVYAYHHIDGDSVMEACETVLRESAESACIFHGG